jgi:hypothetical protein
VPKRAFDCLVNKYDGNKWVKSFTCWNHLLVLIYGQLSNRESLRDLVTSLAPFRNMFHHLGFGANVTRSNLSKANEQRDPRIFEEYALKLISIAREKRTGLKDFFISNNVYAFDSTTISLCLSVFWWTKLHHGKSGVKVHTLFDVKNSIPSFAIITGAEIHDSQVMDQKILLRRILALTQRKTLKTSYRDVTSNSQLRSLYTKNCASPRAVRPKTTPACFQGFPCCDASLSFLPSMDFS